MADGKAPAPTERRSGAPKGPDPLIGRVINDRFRVVSLIARGGMGKVYRAEQAPLGREVALKVLNPNYAGDGDPEFHKRFFLEASTCSKLTHPNTVTIFDYGRTDDDVYYIAMELLEGRTLHRMLRDDGPFAPAHAMHIARQVCRSLREAHAIGVIHRDLKPANIFLVKHGDESDFVKVLDFGLVKEIGDGEDLTQTGLFMGSPKYMSPEQIRGEKVDGRADVYALGVILYEMLTGKVPFDRPSSVNILMAHVHEPPPRFKTMNPAVDIPQGVEDVVMKALAKQPDQRYSGMDDMLVSLKRMSLDAGYSATPSMIDLHASGEHALTTGPHAPIAIRSGEPDTHTPITQVAPVDSMMGQRARSPKAMFALLAVLGLLFLIGAVVATVFALFDDDPVPVAPRVEPVRETETREASSPDVISTMVVLRSTPPGATVRVGDRDFGRTPADIEWTGADAERGRQVTFLFRLEGYRDYSVTRVIRSDRLEVVAELERIEDMPEPANRPRRPRPRDTQGGAPIKGYKLDPY